MVGGSREIRIAFVTKHESWPFWRQMPEHLRSAFTFEATDDADFLVVYDGIAKSVRTPLPLERTLAILPEPPSVKRYNREFLAQFGHVLTVDPRIEHPGRQLGWSTMNWFYGIEFTQRGASPSLASLAEIRLDSETTPKNRLASVVVSDKAFTKGQRFRIRFVTELVSLLGSGLDVFGRGSNPIADKRDAIAPYRFHIALENDCIPHYFTEKLLDSYLGGAFPIYRGAPNINEYFLPECFVQIPESLTPREAAKFSANAIHQIDVDSRAQQLRHAKRLTLSRFNVFEEVFRIVQQLVQGTRFSGVIPRHVQPETRSLGSMTTVARRRLGVHLPELFLP